MQGFCGLFAQNKLLPRLPSLAANTVNFVLSKKLHWTKVDDFKVKNNNNEQGWSLQKDFRRCTVWGILERGQVFFLVSRQKFSNPLQGDGKKCWCDLRWKKKGLPTIATLPAVIIAINVIFMIFAKIVI